MSELIKADQKQLLIATLNKRGFILEKKAWQILFNFRMERSGIQDALLGIERNVLRGRQIEPDETSETDLVFHGAYYVAIIECKRTDYTWIFTKSNNSTVNIISHGYGGVKRRPKNLPEFTVVDSNIAVMVEGDGTLRTTNKSSDYAQTSYKEIDDYAYQLLRNLDSRLGITAGHFPEEFNGKSFPPILLTNAKLGVLEFGDSQINDKGDLTDYNNLSEFPFFAYNKQAIMAFDQNNETDFTKTIFIVNIEHLNEFLELYGSMEVSRFQ
ncbi:MAG: hypothetical protein HYW23_04185 [Candidatus Aenigmarchaeota archaeon]|nr:hypothetical protein [Candidatus Aenigmarchaeota archaeon]